MKLSSEQWKYGISDSHYSGVANLRNVRIDDMGVLRVMNKQSKVSDVPSRVLDIQRSYYETSNNYFAIFDTNVNGTDNGGIYESKSGNFIEADARLSGGIVWRDYFFPIPATPNTDIGYFEDSDNDGSFETQHSEFEVLLTKGQTRNSFNAQFGTLPAGRKIAVITDSVYVIQETGGVYIKDISGSVIATVDTSSYTSSIQDVVKVSDTHFAVVTSETIYVYDLTASLVDSHTEDFSRGDTLRHLECAYRNDGEFVVLSYSEDENDYNEGFLQFHVYEFNGTSIIETSHKTVWNGGIGESLSEDPHIACLNEDIAILYEDLTIAGGYYKIEVLEYSLGSWSVTSTTTNLPWNYYAEIVGQDNKLFLMKNSPIVYQWNDADESLDEIDNSIISPNNIIDIKCNGDYFGIITDDNKYSVYKYVESIVDFTPTIVMRDELYWANGNSIGAMRERGEQNSFDPIDSDTFVIEYDALDLPFGTKITAIADIGLFMAIGTQAGKIYFWDLNNTYYELPVNIGEPIASMKSKNNLLYVVTQTAGNVYVANLTSYEKLRNLSSLTKSRFDVVAGGMDFFDDGSFMGAKVNSDDTYTGIWIYKNNAWTLLGTDEEITSISKATPNVVVYATTSGLYELDIAGAPRALWDNDDAYVITPMMVGGSVANKKVDTHYSLYFDNYFGGNEYVKIYYRTTTAGYWKLIDIKTSTDMGEELGLFAVRGQLGVPKSEQIQYKVVLNTTAGLVLFETV